MVEPGGIEPPSVAASTGVDRVTCETRANQLDQCAPAVARLASLALARLASCLRILSTIQHCAEPREATSRIKRRPLLSRQLQDPTPERDSTPVGTSLVITEHVVAKGRIDGLDQPVLVSRTPFELARRLQQVEDLELESVLTECRPVPLQGRVVVTTGTQIGTMSGEPQRKLLRRPGISTPRRDVDDHVRAAAIWILVARPTYSFASAILRRIHFAPPKRLHFSHSASVMRNCRVFITSPVGLMGFLPWPRSLGGLVIHAVYPLIA